MNSQQNGGAKIEARSPKPSIDLATLVELLAKAIPPKQNSGSPDQLHPDDRLAFKFYEKKNRLRICTPAIIRRLFGLQDFKAAFNPNEGKGFVQNLPTSQYGIDSHIGGCLSEDNAARLPKALDKLILAIDQAIDGALPEKTSLSVLLLDETAKQLQQLAKAASTNFYNQANTATLVPIEFPADIKANTESKPIAKVISALERIEADDYFDHMCSAVKDHLQNNRGADEDDIESAIDSLEAEKKRDNSQLTRFLNFLDDEALARVRLKITFRIMQAIAEHSRTHSQPGHQMLAEYVHRVTSLLASDKEIGYSVDLTTHFGIAAEFELSEQLNNATFYYCLPVWAESTTQIFEEKVRNQAGTSAVVREVSYRFRINGNNPELSKPAFEVRLDKIENELIGEEEKSSSQSQFSRRRLAELIFLAIVIPHDSKERLSAEALSNLVEKLIKYLQTGGKEAIQQTIDDLRERAKSMQAIAIALIEILRTKNQKIISQVQRQSSQQFICVKRDIIDWPRLEAGSGNFLKTSAQISREQVEWFKYIEICDTPETLGLLFSVEVNTEISEHNLVTKGDAYQIKAQRVLPNQLLQIIWVPFSFSKEQDKWTYKPSLNASNAEGWSLPAAVFIDYDVSNLTRRDKEKGSEESKQYHAAAVAAFEVLVYCCLWRVIDRLKQDSHHEFITLMLRLQEQGKESDAKSGDSYIYAAAQTLESILAEDTNIRMQGIVLKNLAKSKDIKLDNSNIKADDFDVKPAIFKALLSAFPLVISTPKPPTIPKIGLISYSTRPCDESSLLNADEKSYLFLTQSYIAESVISPFSGYKLKAARMQSDIVDSPENLKKQRLVQEEISYLKNQGCQHIILLSHAYGGRRFKRIADYNSALTPKEFLEDISQTFADLTIYTLLRDVFPATRLHKRDTTEAGFEILQAGDHRNFLRSLERVSVRDIIPVYTFATLFTIQEEKRPQSGFCVYFLVDDQRVSDINWTERARQNLVNPEGNSSVNPCLISVLRGLHFIEAERGVKQRQLIPVLDPFPWISPNTVEAAGDVEVLHNRRKGRVFLSYPALLTHVSQVLHRRK